MQRSCANSAGLASCNTSHLAPWAFLFDLILYPRYEPFGHVNQCQQNQNGEDQHAIIGQYSVRNSASGNRMNTPATGPYMETMPPKTDQIITWKDKPTSKVEGPTVRMMCAYNPPAIPAKKPLRQKARSLYRVVLIPAALTASSSSRIACNMISGIGIGNLPHDER